MPDDTVIRFMRRLGTNDPSHYEIIHNEFNSQYTRGHTDGYEKGLRQCWQAWNEWNSRRNAAEAEEWTFDEPPPSPGLMV